MAKDKSKTKRKRTGRPRILTAGYKVMAPIKNEQGEWTAKEEIIAAFLDEGDARWYAEFKEKHGVPARLVEPS